MCQGGVMILWDGVLAPSYGENLTAHVPGKESLEYRSGKTPAVPGPPANRSTLYSLYLGFGV